MIETPGFPYNVYSQQEKELLSRAKDAKERDEYGSAAKILFDIFRQNPKNITALTELIDILMLPWFPEKRQMDTAKQLLDLGRKILPDSREIDNLEKKVAVKNAQLSAVQEGNSRIDSYRNKHKAERCVIIGNGPSLNQMDLSFLENEISFGLNRIFLAFDKFGFIPTYLVAVNKYVIEQSAKEIMNVPCMKFISFEGVPHIKPCDDLIVINPRTWEDFFSTDPKKGLCIGSTVTYVAMQLAFWMGFDEVVTIGLDHKYSQQGEPHTVIESDGDDVNHFDPNYFGKGFRWQLPDLKESEQMYRIADAYFRAYRSKIVDATLDGNCPVFEKADYRQIFGLS